MGERSVKGLMLQHAVDQIRDCLAAKTLTREQLELRLERDDLGLFDKDGIVGGLWYPAVRYERLLDLILEAEGRRSEALVDFGRRAAGRLLEAPAFAAMFEAIGRRKGTESAASAGAILVKLAEVLLDFTRWRYLGSRLDDFSVEVTEARDFHDHARYAVQGMIEAFGSRLFGERLEVRSERPTPDRIVFRAALARAG
jgi:hypothetical protein